jgi:hypothetical protein
MSRLIKTLIIVLPAIILLVFSLAISMQAEAGVAIDCEGTIQAWQNDRSMSGFMSSHSCNCSNGSDKSPVCSGSGSTKGVNNSKGSSNVLKNTVKQTLIEGVVGGLLNPPHPKSGKGNANPAAPTISPAQQKINQQIQEEKAAQDAAYSANQQKLLLDLKGDITISKPNVIDLKAPPEPSAVRQLGILEREGRQAVSEGKRSDWENPPKNLPPAVIPKVPDPVGDLSSQEPHLKDLLGQITASRQKVTTLDQEVKQLEETVAKEERKPSTENKGDDDALRKAREALQRAKENRDKTAAELKRLEEQAAAARSATESTTNGHP